MLWRSNKRKDQSAGKTENRITPEETQSPQDLYADPGQLKSQAADAAEAETEVSDAVQPELEASEEELTNEEKADWLLENEEAMKMYREILDIRESVASLKPRGDSDSEELSAEQQQTKAEQPAASEMRQVGIEQGVFLEETEETIAAKQAIIEQARKDAEEQRLQREAERQREAQLQAERQRVLEAQQRAALIEAEAERKRQEALEAEKRAKEISRKKALEEMEAAHRKSLQDTQRMNFAEISAGEATAEEKAAFFDEELPGAEALQAIDQTSAELSGKALEASLEVTKRELLIMQEKQAQLLEEIAGITEETADQLAEAQKAKLEELAEAGRKAIAEQELRLQQQKLRVIQEQEKAGQVQLSKTERQAKARAEKQEKHRKKQEAKQHKHEEKERLKKAKREAAEERARLERQKAADAELGGGVVKVKGVSIKTGLNKVAHFSWRNFFGIRSREEKKATDHETVKALEQEREERKEEARAIVEIVAKQRMERYEQSGFGRKMYRLRRFCDRHKTALLVSFAIVLTAGVATAGVFNYCTAYEYSYKSQTLGSVKEQKLGLVKEKDQVLKITDLVQGALTEDKDMEVIIDVKDDIEFRRVPAMGGVQIDSSDDVLKRLTYMGDLNVKAFGIYVDGEKVGAVESKEVAAQVLQDIKDRYTSGEENAEVEEAIIIEKTEIKESNTALRDVSSEEEMVEKLCTSGVKDSRHKVVVGETLSDIAKLYSLTEKQLLEDNPDVDPRKLEVGSTLVIKQQAPILTVKTTELITYDKKIKHETEKKKDNDMYEGDTETKKKGKDGLSEITTRVVSVNGEAIEETDLVTTVKKEPVTEIIMVGNKERPPTVGDGKFRWPLDGGYTLTSGFKFRWGRQHEGIDLGTPVGNTVRAADGGTVTYAGYMGGYGYLVEIDHQNGYTTRYGHNSSVLVSVGDKVYEGQPIAKSGNTGRSTGPHVHFEIRENGTAKDPLNYLP